MWIAIGLAIMVIPVVFFYDAPLETHSNPLRTPLHTKAPWYFLWIQGMLKLGDPTLMGVILPTVMFGLLFAVPYLDNNPSRLGKNRKVALTLGVLSCLLIVILSYMGLPQWGIETPPAPRILQDLSPQEGEGPIEVLGYHGFHEEIADGEGKIPVGTMKEYYTQELKNIVYDRYEPDFIKFGYKK